MTRRITVYAQAYGSEDRKLTGIKQAVQDCFPSRCRIDFRLVQMVAKPDNSSGIVTPQKLRKALASFAKEREPKEPWIHLVCARKLSLQSHTFGLTYDERTDAPFQRRGCAVFWQPIAKVTDPRFLVRTCVHEIGHVLNLGHEDAEAGAIMAAGRPGVFQLAFSDTSDRHLEWHPDEYVFPGRRPYGDLCADTQHPHPPRSPYGALKSSRSKLDVRLQVFERGAGYVNRAGRILLGQPLFLRSIVRNRRRVRATRLEGSPSGGVDVRLEFRDPGGGWCALDSGQLSCGAPAVSIEPRSECVVDHAISYRGGYPFVRPGRYEIRAVALEGTRRLVSPLHVVHISEPTGARTRARLDAMLSPPFAEALELGFDVEDRRFTREFTSAVRAFPTSDPTRQLGEMVIAREWARRALDGPSVARRSRGVVADLRRVWASRSAPPAVRQEAALWAARVVSHHGDHTEANRLLARLLRLRDGDTRLVERAERELGRVNARRNAE